MNYGNHAATAPRGTRVVMTGAGGNIGRGLAPRLLAAGYQLTLSDLKPVDGLATEARFDAADVRTGGGLQAAMVDADILVHLPALHGIHVADHTETEFWDLNVNGTFRTLQAAVAAGVGKVVWLSSQAWHDSSDVYGFTKVIGEQLLDYHRRRHGISYVAVRPASLVPWTDWARDYGRGLLYERVDRNDVLDAIVLSTDYVAANDGGLVLDALHPDAVPAADLAEWKLDPIGTADRLFPGARTVVQRFGLDISAPPVKPSKLGWTETGYAPSRDFGAWINQVTGLSDDQVEARTSDY
ncbi:NAD-dependent epimerase/dehydratase family protein [Arthrobacter bambusae]|uniref:Nucleoside-diphosphate-sugar epimerase n=1 Tax=Arthrobacter bambusae TaxID=1338426 RepID=A0AAW8DHM1_9MICC|nr:NAD(P)-dependent oxidoreductase [Arthrobacter bambusae]MDP9905466.1 nucleoside-diphosphate-sugar epimerase [Arthrobacter bambusae]MDQ0127452.1 nucleoside-diphosphate-sugar epimerase [Arthrobacter bambusae]MDQ0178794.1 nucleoside-diphosphate-sugar epimerase [Arthrobacter bambusae]